MIIIAIEGLDKAGKFTQCKLLAERLASHGMIVKQSEFHRYDTPTGKLIMDWLTGKYDVDQRTIELIMTADKQAQQEWFEELEEQGVDVLILDRYVTSQMVYSKASGIDSEWVEDLQSYIRFPDYEILIDIPAKESMTRKGKHNNGENDRYESDLVLLSRVRRFYDDIFIDYKDAGIGAIVDGTNSIEEIHDEIWEFIASELL